MDQSGYYQEQGFTPHLVSRSNSQHLDRWMTKKGLTGNALFVTKNTPFIRPVMKTLTKNKILSYFENTIKNTVKKSGG